jgi:hypothetical protein
MPPDLRSGGHKKSTLRIKEQKKVIKIADKYGWDVSKEFKDDPITENSEESQRLRQAEARAKRKRSDKRNNNNPFVAIIDSLSLDMPLIPGPNSALQTGTTPDPSLTEFIQTSACTVRHSAIGALTVRSKRETRPGGYKTFSVLILKLVLQTPSTYSTEYRSPN